MSPHSILSCFNLLKSCRLSGSLMIATCLVISTEIHHTTALYEQVLIKCLVYLANRPAVFSMLILGLPPCCSVLMWFWSHGSQKCHGAGTWAGGSQFLPQGIEHGGRAQSPSKVAPKEGPCLSPSNKGCIFPGPFSSGNQTHLCHRIILGPELGHLLLECLSLHFIMPQYLPASINPMCLRQSYLFSAASSKSPHYSKPSPDTQTSKQLTDFKPQVLYQFWTFSLLPPLLLTVWCHL